MTGSARRCSGERCPSSLVPWGTSWYCPAITESLRGNCLLSHPGSWPGSGEFSGHLSSGVRTEEARNWREGWGRAGDVPGAETRPLPPGGLSAGQTLTLAVPGGQPTGNPFSGLMLWWTWSGPLSPSLWEQRLIFGAPPSWLAPVGLGGAAPLHSPWVVFAFYRCHSKHTNVAAPNTTGPRSHSSAGQKSRLAQRAPLPQVSQGQNQGVGWAACFSGGSVGQSLASPFRVLARFCSCGCGTEVPISLLAVSRRWALS